jgi:hypothetical protein
MSQAADRLPSKNKISESNPYTARKRNKKRKAEENTYHTNTDRLGSPTSSVSQGQVICQHLLGTQH